MKHGHIMIILFCALAGAGVTLAVSAENCDSSRQFGNLEVKLYKSKWGGCKLSAGQTYDYGKQLGKRYRSFTFSANGQVMMFVNTDDDERLSRATGSRCFHLLPFKRPVEPSYTDNGDGTVTLNLPSGHTAVFSTSTGEPISIEGFNLKISPLQHMSRIEKNRGFVEIVPQQGFLLFDYGWRTGEVPISQLYRDITIVDGSGASCRAKMSDVFKKDPRDPDEVVFIHDTNEKLKAFLKRKCPALSFAE
jgi:hypothetical protein